MHTSPIRLVVLLGIISVFGIIALQVKWFQNAYAHEAIRFDRSVRIALRIVAENLAISNNSAAPSQSIVDQHGSNVYVVNTNSHIDADLLEKYLLTEFKTHEIDTVFEYSIYDCSSEKLVYGNYVGKSHKDSHLQQELSKLPKYNKTLNYYFVVSFPSRANYMAGQLDFWMLTSLILLVVIFFFGYAMFVILQQKRLSEVQKDFINNMTHEFKTPISTITIAAGVLADPAIVENPARLKTYANIIGQESSRLFGQVEKVLQMARLDRGETKLNLELLDLHAVALQVVQTICPGLSPEEPEINLSVFAPEAFILADRLHLTNIIFNLLDNAVKYSPGRAHITLRSELKGNKIVFSVSDTGQGIPQKYQGKIFDKFFRVPTGNVHDVKGFGLGLNYVRNIVRAHHWKISLQSVPGQGSTFTVSIPTAR
ncbi:MAG: HAMP domain-containing sensor histidine kinase [Bacteroidota bacterium]